jgi:PAS domain S-box-containing protein
MRMDMPEPSSGNSKHESFPSWQNTSADAWLAAIVNSSDDAIIGKTLDGTIRSWNSGATRIFGYEAAEAIGRSVLMLIPPELRYEEPEIVGRLSRGERIDHFETVRVRRDGSRVDISLSVSPIRDRNGNIVGGAKIARDVTEARRLQQAERESAQQLQELATELEQQVEEAQSLQEELEQTNEELARAATEAEEARQQAEDANAAKSQFLAMMSHELRTPLNAIAGYVELLDMGVRGPMTEQQRHDLGRIKHSQQTLLRLIDDVLSFAKIESGHLEYQFQDARLDEFLNSLEIFIAPRLSQKGLEYRVATCAEDVRVSIDRAKAEQIALNLLSNAVKFTDRGHVEIQCAADDREVRISVSDTGRGISADLLDSIFEPFVQGNRSLTSTVEGTGLGLPISRQLARGMGGDIVVESTVGVGSCFTLVLPRRHPGSSK